MSTIVQVFYSQSICGINVKLKKILLSWDQKESHFIFVFIVFGLRIFLCIVFFFFCHRKNKKNYGGMRIGEMYF